MRVSLGADHVVLEADAASAAQRGEPLRHEEGRLRLGLQAGSHRVAGGITQGCRRD